MVSPDFSQDERPEWESLLAGLEALHGVLDDEHLVDVEGDAQDVAQEEDADEAHEHHRQVVLLPTPSLIRKGEREGAISLSLSLFRRGQLSRIPNLVQL